MEGEQQVAQEEVLEELELLGKEKMGEVVVGELMGQQEEEEHMK